MARRLGLAGRLAAGFIHSKLTPRGSVSLASFSMMAWAWPDDTPGAGPP